jgi:hypothetical protein
MWTFAISIVILLTTTHAYNDWSVPCITGSCSYDFTGDEKTAPTSMSLVCVKLPICRKSWHSPRIHWHRLGHSISSQVNRHSLSCCLKTFFIPLPYTDITQAAGWQILDCDSGWSNGSHAIRMVCNGTSEQMEQCSHLDDHGGAPNTVVRLPESVRTSCPLPPPSLSSILYCISVISYGH